MDGIYFSFMEHEIWDGLVLATILIGASLAVLRLMSDWSLYQRQQQREMSASPPEEPSNPAAYDDDNSN